MESEGDRAAPAQASPRRIVLQVALALLAILLVLVLVDALENGSDSVIPGLTETLSSTGWALVILPTLAIIFFVELFLLAVPRSGRSEDSVGSLMLFMGVEPRAGQRLLMGCHGCGTLFEHDETTNKPFACPNCGRTGVYQGSKAVTAPIQALTCTSCDQAFEAYLEHPECPHCHAAQ